MATQTTTSTQNQRAAKGGAEGEIRELLNRFTEVFRSADINKILEFYADDVVAFDMVPPLQFSGKNAYSESWKQSVQGPMKGPFIWEPRDEKIYVSGDIAFVHHLVKCGATGADGKPMSGWIRHGFGLQKRSGKWLIVHDHFSVPVDMKDSKALMELDPDSGMKH